MRIINKLNKTLLVKNKQTEGFAVYNNDLSMLDGLKRKAMNTNTDYRDQCGMFSSSRIESHMSKLENATCLGRGYGRDTCLYTNFVLYFFYESHFIPILLYI